MSLNDQFDALPVAFGSSKPKNDVHSFKNRNRSNVDRIAESGFQKTFTFSNTRAFNFPKIDDVLIHPKWEVNELQKFKEELNAVKSKLNEYNFQEWHTHTRMNNHAGTVMRSVRKFHPEYLTQAWCKFYEIVSRYKLIPKQSLKKKKLNSVHLCEAPGAFVASLNHFLKLNHPEIQWEWMASTLSPYYEGNDLHSMVSDDRFIINTLKNWWFGPDQTGNVYSENYLESLIERVKPLYPVYLVTSDGSISCIDDPAEQEKNVVHLHFIETICALNILERDGSFLLKMFTMFESETVCLMYLLRCCFTHLNVFKPVTSKEGNSEVYVVCTGYKGKNHVPILEALNDSYRLKNWEKNLFSVDQIPKAFLQEVIDCAKKFKTIQEEVIERNIRTFESKNKRKKNYLQLIDIREITANKYIERYQIRPIPTSDFVEKNLHVETYCLNYFPRDESGTFLERRMFKTLDLKSMVDFYRTKLTSIPDKETSDILYYSLNEKVDFELIWGDPVRKIVSSKFCAGNLLCILNDLEDLRIKHQVSIKNKNLNEIANETHLDLKKYKIIDLCDISWIENYPLSKSTFYSKLIDLINNLELNDNILLFNVPLLTQFNAGILFILGHFFEKVGFSNTSNYLIMLENLNDIKIKETIKNMNISDIDRLLFVIPVNKLCESRFVNYVADMNQRVLKETCLTIISNLEASQD